MTLHHKKRRPLQREEGEERPFRDAPYIVIATEDKYAPKQYFRAFKSQRLRVEVLETADCRSAPEHVLQRLDDYVKESQKKHQMGDDDEFWLMLDTDHWTEPNHLATFSKVCAAAIGKGFHLAHSNPCFEMWLLLHHVDLDPGDEFENAAEVEKRLRAELGEYNKCRLNLAHFPLSLASVAAERAEALDIAPNDLLRWPQKPGSHVYRLVKRLLSAKVG